MGVVSECYCTFSEGSPNYLLSLTTELTDINNAHNARITCTNGGTSNSRRSFYFFRVIQFGGDDGPMTPHLDESLSFVDDGVAAGGVLIHCTHGTGRSAAMAIAAAMKENGKGTPAGVGDFAEAFQVVKSRRPGTDPPMPFQKELDEWASSKSA